MSYLVDKHMITAHTDAHTNAGNDNTRRPKLASGKNLNVSRLILKLSLPNPVKPGVKSRMKM